MQGQAGFCVVEVEGGEGLDAGQAVAEGVAVYIEGVCGLGGVAAVAEISIRVLRRSPWCSSS